MISTLYEPFRHWSEGGSIYSLNIHGHDHNSVEPYKEGCKHINLAANVCGFSPINLGKIIKDGAISDIPSIHRVTIDGAVPAEKDKGSFKLNRIIME